MCLGTHSRVVCRDMATPKAHPRLYNTKSNDVIQITFLLPLFESDRIGTGKKERKKVPSKWRCGLPHLFFTPTASRNPCETPFWVPDAVNCERGSCILLLLWRKKYIPDSHRDIWYKCAEKHTAEDQGVYLIRCVAGGVYNICYPHISNKKSDWDNQQ